MFEEGILLGAETDTSLLACDAASHHQPLTVVERTVSVYLLLLYGSVLYSNVQQQWGLAINYYQK